MNVYQAFVHHVKYVLYYEFLFTNALFILVMQYERDRYFSQLKLKYFLIINQIIFQHNTIEAVLERGEKLDDLVAKSEGLSMQSKAFYKTAKKTNACCRM